MQKSSSHEIKPWDTCVPPDILSGICPNRHLLTD
jgi:hypothetical protein